MRMPFCVLLLISFVAHVNAQDFSGRYSGDTAAGTAIVEVTVATDGSASGKFSLSGYPMVLSGALLSDGSGLSDGSQLAGNLIGEFEMLGFLASKQDDILVLSVFGYDMLGQPDLASAQTLTLAPTSAGTEPESSVGADAARPSGVFINRTELTSAQLEDITARYGTTIPSGRYWYDVRCGAWGVEGGPTLGFTAAGLELAGPMPSDISMGGTGIFINGREIHQQDRMALVAMLGVAYPGRYTLDAIGNLSVEGGAFLVNLVQASRSSQQSASGGGLYSGMGGTVGTDGSGGVLFYTKNASGGYNTYNN